jgi:uncharacterized membrane protein
MAPLAFHPDSIWAAVEIRTSAFCILLSVLLLFCDAYLTDAESSPAQKRYAWGYGLTALAALYSHYFLACLLVRQGQCCEISQDFYGSKVRFLRQKQPISWP